MLDSFKRRHRHKHQSLSRLHSGMNAGAQMCGNEVMTCRAVSDQYV